MSARKSTRPDIYTRVTTRIIEDLEQGVRPWMKPWDARNTEGRIMAPLRHNGVPYTGINILMLRGSAVEQGFSAPTCMTFRRAKELGGHVCKGEKGSPVVYANTLTHTEEDEHREAIETQIPSMVPTPFSTSIRLKDCLSSTTASPNQSEAAEYEPPTDGRGGSRRNWHTRC